MSRPVDSESTNIDFSLIADTIFLLLRGYKITHKQYFLFNKNIEDYNKLIDYKSSPISFQSLYSGTSPHYRLVSNYYVLSMLPLPKVSMKLSSPFDFYNHHTDINKKANKISTLIWFNQFCKSVVTFLNNNELINIPEFPTLEEIQDDKVEIKKSVLNWMLEIIHPPSNEEKDDKEMNQNESIIKRVDQNFHVIHKEEFDPSNVHD